MLAHVHTQAHREIQTHKCTPIYIHTYLITATDALIVTLFTLFCVIVREGVTADRQTTYSDPDPSPLPSHTYTHIYSTDNGAKVHVM